MRVQPQTTASDIGPTTTQSQLSVSLTPLSPPPAAAHLVPDSVTGRTRPATTLPGDVVHHRRTLPKRDGAIQRRGRKVFIPRQVHGVELTRDRVVVNWNLLRAKSATILSLPSLRNHVCRKICRLANFYRGDRPIDEWQSSTNVVYVAFHAPTSRFYVGETGRTAEMRLHEHWHARYRASGYCTALSELMIELVRSNPRCIEEFRLFVVAHTTTDHQRKVAEMNIIAYLRQGRTGRFCVNKQVPHGKRLRHRAWSSLVPAEPSPNVLPDATIQRVARLPALQHLLALKPSGQVVALNAMSMSLLRRLLCHVRQGPLRNFILDTLSAKKSDMKAKSSRTYFVAPFASTKIDSISLRRLLCKSHATWPLSDAHLKECGVAYQLNREVGQVLRNFTDCSLNIDACCMECDCEQYPDRFRMKEAGADGIRHILTADPDIFAKMLSEQEAELMASLLMKRGSKFRYSKNDLYASVALTEAAEGFLRRCAKKENRELSQEEVDKWVSGFRLDVERKLKMYDVRRIIEPDLRSMAAKVKDRFVISPADKNPQHSVVWCKKLYFDKIVGALKDSFSMCGENEDAVSVIKRHQNLAKKYFHRSYASLPYLYAMPKLHKLETHRNPFRFIVGKSKNNHPELPEDLLCKGVSGKNTLTDVRKHLASALDSVIDLLLIKQRYEEVKRCWIVRDTQEFIDTTSVLQVDESTELTTADFTTMYTQLPHDVVVECVCEAIDDALPVLRDLNGLPPLMSLEAVADAVCFGTDGQWFMPKPGERRVGWTVKQVKQAVRDVVGEAYVYVDGVLFRQTVGIGMGHEESPPLANLTLYAFEKAFVNKCIAEMGPSVVERKFHNFKYHCRFIDDIFAPTPPDALPTMHEYGGLNYAITGNTNNIEEQFVVFLGIKVSIKEQRLVYRARDKQHAFNFELTRFPSWDSCHPRSCMLGTVMGMLTRTLRFTTEVEALFQESQHILQCFIKRGYPLEVLEKCVRSFGRRQLLSSGRKLVSTPLCVWLRSQSRSAPAPVPPPAPPPPPVRPSQQREEEIVSSDDEPCLDPDLGRSGVQVSFRLDGDGPVVYSVSQSTQTEDASPPAVPHAPAAAEVAPPRSTKSLKLRLRPREDTEQPTPPSPYPAQHQPPRSEAHESSSAAPCVASQGSQPTAIYITNNVVPAAQETVVRVEREAQDREPAPAAPTPTALTTTDSTSELRQVCQTLVEALTQSVALQRANEERRRLPEGQEVFSIIHDMMKHFQRQMVAMLRAQQEAFQRSLRASLQAQSQRPQLHGDFLLSLQLLRQIAEKPPAPVNVNFVAPQAAPPVVHNHLTVEAPPQPALPPIELRPMIECSPQVHLECNPSLQAPYDAQDVSARIALLESGMGRMLQTFEGHVQRESLVLERLLTHGETIQSNALQQMSEIVAEQRRMFIEERALGNTERLINAIDGRSELILKANQTFQQDCVRQLSGLVSSAGGHIAQFVETTSRSQRISDTLLEHLAEDFKNQRLRSESVLDQQTFEGKFRAALMAIIEQALRQQSAPRRHTSRGAAVEGPYPLPRAPGPTVYEPSASPQRDPVSAETAHIDPGYDPQDAAAARMSEPRGGSMPTASRESSPPPRAPTPAASTYVGSDRRRSVRERCAEDERPPSAARYRRVERSTTAGGVQADEPQ